jgi:hypothetical protein
MLLRSFFLVLLLVSPSARAELYECNGTWTNKPCSGKTQKTIDETKAQKRSPAEIEKSQKDLWLHDLETKRFNARRMHGIKIDTKDAAVICQSEKTTLLECRKAITTLEDKIEERVVAAQQLKLKKQEVESKKVEDNSSQVSRVTIIQNTIQRNRIVVQPRENELTPPAPQRTLSPIPSASPLSPRPRRFSRGGSIVSN